MSTIIKSAIVPYSAEQMYSLVNDIDSYPHFLPWCTQAVVSDRSDTRLTASVSLASGKIAQTFTTENRMEPGKRIDVKLVSGPFSHLDGSWQFNDIGNNLCQIDLKMDFEFKNRLLKMALSPVFNQFMARLVSSFVDRANNEFGGHGRVEN